MGNGVVRDQQAKGLREVELRAVFRRFQQWLAIDQVADKRTGAGVNGKHFDVQAIAQYQRVLPLVDVDALQCRVVLMCAPDRHHGIG
ncbi:hypothetical protein D3C81_1857990 [compost metagenome]